MDITRLAPMKRTSAMEQARRLRLETIARSKLNNEAFEENRRLGRLLAHAGLLESIEREQQCDQEIAREQAYQAGIVSAESSIEQQLDEPFSMGAITAALEDMQQLPSTEDSEEDEDDESDWESSEEDDMWSRRSSLSSTGLEEAEDCFGAVHGESNADRLERKYAMGATNGLDALETSASDLKRVASRWDCGAIEMLDIDEAASKSTGRQDGDIFVEIAECID